MVYIIQKASVVAYSRMLVDGDFTGDKKDQSLEKLLFMTETYIYKPLQDILYVNFCEPHRFLRFHTHPWHTIRRVQFCHEIQFNNPLCNKTYMVYTKKLEILWEVFILNKCKIYISSSRWWKQTCGELSRSNSNWRSPVLTFVSLFWQEQNAICDTSSIYFALLSTNQNEKIIALVSLKRINHEKIIEKITILSESL